MSATTNIDLAFCVVFGNVQGRGNRAFPLLQNRLSYHPSNDLQILSYAEIKPRRGAVTILSLHQTHQARRWISWHFPVKVMLHKRPLTLAMVLVELAMESTSLCCDFDSWVVDTFPLLKQFN